jgi:S-DNA-T family DNA segregation ATPase FtsK/SpoIIIE
VGKKKATRKGKGKSAARKRGGGLAAFVRSERFAHIRGTIYVLFALFLFIALAGYFATGFHGGWLGSAGKATARFFADRLFGIASIGFVWLFFVYGMRLWKVEIAPWWKTLGITLFWMVWFSVTLGYIGGAWVKSASGFEPCAGVGLSLAEPLHEMISWWTLVLLVVVAVAFLVMVHKMELPKVKMPSISPDTRKAMADSLVRGLQTVVADGKEVATDEEEEPKEDFVDLNLARQKVNETTSLQDKETKSQREQETTSQQDAELTSDSSEEVHFSIDDEFERINARARGTSEEINFTINEATSQQDNETTGQQDNEATSEQDVEEDPDDYRRHYGIDEPYDPHLDLGDYIMPSTDLLEDWEVSNVRVTKEELVANKDRIVHTLRDYGIEITDITATPGPTVTLYEIKPAPGVRISKIKGLEDDIALSLSALGIRIIAPIPGKGTVGIEVPNTKPQVVSMKTMLECDAFKNDTKMELPVALGKTISNEPFVTDLAKMPHLLMAGATGTGKSVGLNAVITSLLYKKHPSELKLVLVDPKKVELSLYSAIDRHYLAKMPDADDAIITDVKKVVRTLNSLCIEMDSRYDLLKSAKVRKITEYNEKFCKRMLNPEHGHRYLPYIVLIIDEFADLIMTAGKEVEQPIARLAQLARAVGIHLIIATQRPTTNIITGTIKANFPARVAFRVTSGIDSRTILDTGGAQQLIGRGDMLISLAGKDMVRLQCALIETAEIDRLVKFIGDQRGYPEGFELPEYLDENEEPNKDFDAKHKDEYFNDAARLVVASQFGSTSLLQRKLQLGYNRAGRIIDQLEAAGIVGPSNGSKPRDVLVHDEATLEELLRSL